MLQPAIWQQKYGLAPNNDWFPSAGCMAQQYEVCEYLKKFYDSDSSLHKLTRLIDHYHSNKPNRRYLHRQALAMLSKNQKSTLQCRSSLMSNSNVDFNLCAERILPVQLAKSKNSSCECLELLETLDSLYPGKTLPKVSSFSKQNNKELYDIFLNYVPYRRINKTDEDKCPSKKPDKKSMRLPQRKKTKNLNKQGAF